MNSLNKKKQIFFIITMMFFINFFLANVNSTCIGEPEKISIISGNENVGIMPLIENTNKAFFVRGNLQEYPIGVNIYYKKTGECELKSEDVKIQFWENSGVIESNQNIKTDGEYVIYEFKEQMNKIATDFKTKLFSNGKTYNLNILVDDDKPTLEIIPQNQNGEEIQGEYLKSGTKIIFNYTISDNSGLKSISIDNGVGTKTFYENEKEWSGIFETTISQTTTYIITVTDVLGSMITKEFTFNIKDVDPTLDSELVAYKQGTDLNGNRLVSFKILVSDPTYSNTNKPIVLGNFTGINDIYQNKKAICEQKINNKFLCKWDNLIIKKLTKTSLVKIPITISDEFGNEVLKEFNIKVIFDTDPPKITKFELINDLEEEGIFSAYGTNSKIYLEVTDESLGDDVTNLRLIKDFELSNERLLELMDNCEAESGLMKCMWNLSDGVNIFKGENIGEANFKILLIDKYGNRVEQTLTVPFENDKPVVEEVEFLETDEIKDHIFVSNEKINVRIKFKDENWKQGEKFLKMDMRIFGVSDILYADFCDENYDGGLIMCEFRNIELGYGPKIENISFSIYDRAGNYKLHKEEFKLYKKENQVASETSFEIKPIEITNVLDRYVIMRKGYNAWFEGEIKDLPNQKYKIVNYQLIGDDCNSENLKFEIGEKVLYPEQVVYFDEEKGVGTIERKFALKIWVNRAVNESDLFDQTLKCKMSVLKVDENSAYLPEIVNFDLKFKFYNIPERNIINAKAQSILDDIKKNKDYREFITGTKKILDAMTTTCSIANQILGTISSISTIWNTAAIALESYPAAKAITEPVSNILNPTDGVISDLNFVGQIQKVCGWITCEGGGILSKLWKNKLDGVNPLQWVNKQTGKLCTDTLAEDAIDKTAQTNKLNVLISSKNNLNKGESAETLINQVKN